MRAPSGFRPERLNRPDWYVERGGEWRLRATRCTGCGWLTFPAAKVCPRCWPTPPLEETVLPDSGTLLSWSTATIAPLRFRPPYAFGYADLTPTVRLFGQIEHDGDEGALALDMRIDLVLGVVSHDEKGEPVWAYKFAPTKGGAG
jgi:uncharacterized OB-fold protein